MIHAEDDKDVQAWIQHIRNPIMCPVCRDQWGDHPFGRSYCPLGSAMNKGYVVLDGVADPTAEIVAGPFVTRAEALAAQECIEAEGHNVVPSTEIGIATMYDRRQERVIGAIELSTRLAVLAERAKSGLRIAPGSTYRDPALTPAQRRLFAKTLRDLADEIEANESNPEGVTNR
jgi:hypothetical protein